MTSRLGQRIKQTRAFASIAEEALLGVVVAASEMREQIDQACKKYDVGTSHYNVLRILRGAPEKGYPRCDVIERMLDPAPDVTRLIDSLEKKGLVKRERCKEDRRMSMHRITDAGRALLDEMHDDVTAVLYRFGERFTEEELIELSHLCERIYAPEAGAVPASDERA